jgi:hypothetical protein
MLLKGKKAGTVAGITFTKVYLPYQMLFRMLSQQRKVSEIKWNYP